MIQKLERLEECQKGEVSKRLKFVADELGLKYEPETKINGGKSIWQIKQEHKKIRNEKIKQLNNIENVKQEYNRDSNELKIYIDSLKQENNELKDTINKLIRRGFTLYKNTKLQWANLFISSRVEKLEKQLSKKQEIYNKLLQKYTKLKQVNKNQST